MSGFELGTDGPGVILVGVDGSRTALRAWAYAAGLARRQGASLLLAHVVAPSAMAGLAAMAGAMYAESAQQESEELRARPTDAPHPVRAEFLVLHGDPYDQLSRLAEERRVDAVVVGASEAAGHRLVGSLASRLVRASTWPVAVVP